MSPWIVGFTVFFGYPLVATVYLSFTHYDLLQAVALDRARQLQVHVQRATSRSGRRSRTRCGWSSIAVPLKVMFAFGVALMLTRARRGVGFFRTIFYLPALAPPVAATLGFVYLLNPATGPGQPGAGLVGIDGPLWFNDPSWSKPALTLLLMWGVGNMMIIFLAALVDVPRHLYESAELDGAGAWQRLRWVTLPAISPVILFAVVIGTIEALQLFDQAYVGATIAAGSASSAGDPSNDLGYPEDSTLFYPVLLFQQGFRFFNMGYAAAMAVLLLVVSFAITLMIVRNSRRWVHYAGRAAEMSTTAPPPSRSPPPRAARAPRGPARGPPPALPGRGRRAQPADRGGDRVRLPVRLHAADVADDERPGALDEAVAGAVPVEQLQRRSSTRRRCCATRSTR